MTAPLHRLEEIELPPFDHAIRHGVASLMTAHVRYEALDGERPATLSPAILRTLLREQLGYNGVVLTDDLEMNAISIIMELETPRCVRFLPGAMCY